MKYPKVINYYLSIIFSWDLELISCLMDQSSRQTCMQKLIVMMTSTYKYCVLPEKKLMFIPSPMEEIYTSPLSSPPLWKFQICFIHCLLKFSLRRIPFLLQFPIPSKGILVFSTTLPLNFWPYRRRAFPYADHFFILVPSKGVDLL